MRTRAQLGAVVSAALLLGLTTILAIQAWHDDTVVFGHSTLVVSDVAVGVGYVLAALLAAGSSAQRWLVALVGPAWLAGSVYEWAVPLHQSALVVALVAYPAGRLVNLEGGVALAAAAALTIFAPTSAAVAVSFAVLTVLLLAADARSIVRTRSCAVVAALIVAAALAHAWWLDNHVEPAEPGVYQAAIGLVAAGFIVATRVRQRRIRDLANVALEVGASGQLAGLERVLRDILGDSRLTVTEGADGDAGHQVRADAQVIATVHTRSTMLNDPVVSEAVDTAVRLTVEHALLRAADQRRLSELDASRARLLASADSERARAAGLLAERVGATVEAAVLQLSAVLTDAESSEAGEFASSALASLSVVSDEIDRIVAGSPPVELGDGRLAGALQDTSVGSAIPVEVAVTGSVAAEAFVETSLFYICREAVANASKHSAATRILIELSADDDAIQLTIDDDGRGGADTAGSGMTGLTDRARAIGASLTVASPRGQGTRISVRWPRTGPEVSPST